MSYENAPQTIMLATHCIICGKELCDARSVEVGLGPVCRKKAGYEAQAQEISEESRERANKLIHQISTTWTTDARGCVAALNELLGLGFSEVVKAILRSVAAVVITVGDDGRFWVKSTYNPEAVAGMRDVSGRRWDKEHKINTFPAASKVDLWKQLVKHYPGKIGVGPKGVFVLEEAPTVAYRSAAAA